MTHESIFVVSTLLLLAFGLEHLGKRTGVPSVVALIVVGFALKPVLQRLGVELGDLQSAVSLLGTIGLVMIVLEGAFDLELARERLPGMLRAFAAALLGMGVLGSLLAGVFVLAWDLSVFQALLLAVPMSVIGSAIAIPSSAFLPMHWREFIVYESSISDILGILVFFAMLESDGSWSGVGGNLAGSGGLSLLLGMLCAVALIAALIRIQGHVRFVPLLAVLFFLYAGGKLMHLSPLIMVLVFGLVLNNLVTLQGWPWVGRVFHADNAQETVAEFRTLVSELTFAVRGIFFILLGYWTDPQTLTGWATWGMALLMLALTYGSRWVMLKGLRVQAADAMTWVAPRGLITVLLYLSAREVLNLPAYMDGAVMLTVMLSALATGVGRWLWTRQAPF